MLRAGLDDRRARARTGLREPRRRAGPRRRRPRDPRAGRAHPGRPADARRAPERTRRRLRLAPQGPRARADRPHVLRQARRDARHLRRRGLGPERPTATRRTRYRNECEQRFAELTGDEPLPVVVDGCGAPAFSAAVAGVARAYARIATAPAGAAERRVATAMREHPWYVGGTGTLVTRLSLRGARPDREERRRRRVRRGAAGRAGAGRQGARRLPARPARARHSATCAHSTSTPPPPTRSSAAASRSARCARRSEGRARECQRTAVDHSMWWPCIQVSDESATSPPAGR